MKKNGFTLVEILAVLVLVAAIMVISVPSIINYINKSKIEISEVTQNLIYSGAELYIDANKSDYPELPEGRQCIQLKDIVDFGLLEAPIIDSVSGEEIDLNKYVKVLYAYDETLKTVKKVYSITEYCPICNGVTVATTGTIPSSTEGYAPGDEYICEVGPNMNYHFFVVSTEENEVNLLMDSNVDLDGKPIKEIRATNDEWRDYLSEWITLDDYTNAGGTEADYGEYGNNNKGPLTLISYLEQATKSWVNINSRTFIYNDINGKYSLTVNNNTRLPNVNELKNTGCQIHTDKGISTDLATCPLWIVNYIGANNSRYDEFKSDCACGSTCSTTNIFNKYACRTEVYALGYWLMDTVENYSNRAYTIGYAGDIDGDTDVKLTRNYGVRPVITVSKQFIAD